MYIISKNMQVKIEWNQTKELCSVGMELLIKAVVSHKVDIFAIKQSFEFVKFFWE